MKSKEALSILRVKRSYLSRYVRRGDIRKENLSGSAYDYNEEDVLRTARQLEEKRKRRNAPPHREASDIARILDMDLDLLRSEDRTRTLSDQRRVLASVLAHLGWTRNEIGEAMNRKGCSVTAMIQTSYLVEDEARKAIELIKNSCYGKKEER